MEELNKVLQGITSVSIDIAHKTQAHIDNLIKPPASLGALEEIAVKIAAITGKVTNKLDKKCVVIFASDNGICEEGVSSIPVIVTAKQTINIAKRGIAAINVLSRQAQSDVFVVDLGVKADLPNDTIINRKIRWGTHNMLHQPAMTREEAVEAIEIGIRMAEKLAGAGYQVIGAGEKGIGNTSTSGAVIMSLTGLGADDVIGKGAGLTEENFVHKKKVLTSVLAERQPDPKDPLDVLSKLGGFDIAGIVGLFLGCAYYKIPAVIDGLITIAGALLASKLNPLTVQYMIPSHLSAEPGYIPAKKRLGITPYLMLDMRLGEGTGCPIAFYLIDCALAIGREMGICPEAF